MVFSFLLRIQLYEDISDSYIHILQTQWLALLLAWAFAATKSVTKLSEYLAPAIKSLISYLISNNDSNLDAFVNHSTWLRCNSFCTHTHTYIYIYIYIPVHGGDGVQTQYIVSTLGIWWCCLINLDS